MPSNRISILLLESKDIFLGNYSKIAEIVTQEVVIRNDVPNKIYLIETYLSQWAVSILKEGIYLFPNIEALWPHYLDPITE